VTRISRNSGLTRIESSCHSYPAIEDAAGTGTKLPCNASRPRQGSAAVFSISAGSALPHPFAVAASGMRGLLPLGHGWVNADGTWERNWGAEGPDNLFGALDRPTGLRDLTHLSVGGLQCDDLELSLGWRSSDRSIAVTPMFPTLARWRSWPRWNRSKKNRRLDYLRRSWGGKHKIRALASIPSRVAGNSNVDIRCLAPQADPGSTSATCARGNSATSQGHDTKGASEQEGMRGRSR
jgi:hypothetical protein